MSEGLERLEPEEVQAGLDEGRILLIDVREPLEYAQARIPGALLYPLSTFDPRALPETEKRLLVFSCRSGARSVTAFNRAAAAGLKPHGHLEGGIIAWVNAGLPVIETDPATGQPRRP